LEFAPRGRLARDIDIPADSATPDRPHPWSDSVFDLATLFDMAVPVAALIAAIVIVRRLSGDQPVNLVALFGDPLPLPWPRGVQEEDPQPWRFDTPGARAKPAFSADTTCRDDRPAWSPARPTTRAGLPTV
jgi:hypothetical protein